MTMAANVAQSVGLCSNSDAGLEVVSREERMSVAKVAEERISAARASDVTLTYWPATALAYGRNKVKAYVALTKPRIMILLLFTALCAMDVAQGRWPGLGVSLYTVVGLGLASGAGAAINMWYDRDIDAVMNRTKGRPLPAGEVSPLGTFIFGIALEVGSMAVLAARVNVLTAALSLVGFLYYVVIYTMWLKRRTPQNIVIGGGAGAFPPLIGWTAVTGHVSLGAVWLFLIVLWWTPPHFWSLALYKNDDYVRARVPMMPVVRGARSTKRQSVAYTLLLLATSLTLPLFAHVSIVYEIVVALVGAVFFFYTVKMWRESDQEFVWTKRTFFASLAYLPLVFLALVIH